MDVEDTTCEHCAFEEDETKGHRLATAFVKLLLGVMVMVLSAIFDSFFLQLAGFVVLLLGLLKLLEITIIGQAPPAQKR